MPYPTPTPEQERGKSRLPATPVDPKGMPRGGGMQPIANFQQFQGIYNQLSRLYYSWFDEALQDNYRNAYRMKLDPMISTCLEVRATPSALLGGDVTPQDDDDEAQLAAAKRVSQDLKALPGFASMRRAMLVNGIFTGVSGAQLTWGWVPVRGTLRMRPTSFSHVDGDSIALDFSGWPGIRVQTGLFHENTVPDILGMVYKLTAEDRECFCLFKHNPQAAEYWRPQAARQVIGSGLRNRLYWLWALKSQLWQMSLDYLSWFARGMTFIFYEHGNDQHLTDLKTAMSTQDGSGAYYFPVMRDPAASNQPYFQKPFEHVQVGTANASFLQELITSYVDEMIRFVILHQSLTTTTGATGLGSEVAAAHETTFDSIVKMDSLQFDECITQDIVSVLYRVNEPGVPVGRYVSQVDSPNIQQIIDGAEKLIAMGGTIPEKFVKDAMGVPPTKPGDTILGGIQPNQPAAIGDVPDNVPMVGANPTGEQPLQGPPAG